MGAGERASAEPRIVAEISALAHVADAAKPRRRQSRLLFGFLLVRGLISLVRPTTISLGPDGLTVRRAWRATTRPWSALSNFRLWRYRTTTLIVFDDAAPRSVFAKLNTAIAGANSALPPGLEEAPEPLLEQLKAAAAKWG